MQNDIANLEELCGGDFFRRFAAFFLPGFAPAPFLYWSPIKLGPGLYFHEASSAPKAWRTQINHTNHDREALLLSCAGYKRPVVVEGKGSVVFGRNFSLELFPHPKWN